MLLLFLSLLKIPLIKQGTLPSQVSICLSFSGKQSIFVQPAPISKVLQESGNQSSNSIKSSLHHQQPNREEFRKTSLARSQLLDWTTIQSQRNNMLAYTSCFYFLLRQCHTKRLSWGSKGFHFNWELTYPGSHIQVGEHRSTYAHWGKVISEEDHPKQYTFKRQCSCEHSPMEPKHDKE